MSKHKSVIPCSIDLIVVTYFSLDNIYIFFVGRGKGIIKQMRLVGYNFFSPW